MSAWADKLIAWDEQAFLDINAWLHQFSAESLNVGPALRAANEFGTGWLLVLAALVIVAVEGDWRCVGRRLAELGAGAGLAGLAASVLKHWTARPRPQQTLSQAFEQGIAHIGFGERVMGLSWPSGHTATAFAAATILAWWTQSIPQTGRRRFVRAMFFAIAAATGVARIYGAAHYPLDVISGAILGVTVGTVVVVISRNLAGFYPRR